MEKVTRKSGRPRKISERDGRALIRGLQRLRLRGRDVTVKTVVQESGCSFQQAHRRTFSRFLNEKGYGYLIARRIGIVSERDRRIRLQYARKMKRKLSRNPDFFKRDIAFYLDGVSFVHKHNPLQAAAATKSRIWRKKNEGLQFTVKGSKDLAGGPRLHLIVAIAYGKGVDQNGTGNGSLSWTMTPVNEVRKLKGLFRTLKPNCMRYLRDHRI